MSSLKLFPTTALPSLACKRAGIDKIGVSGCSVDKESIHLLSDYFSHDRKLQISQNDAISVLGQTKGDGMYNRVTKTKAL